MSEIIERLSRFQVAKIKADPRVDDVEAEGMDEGRFFVHLKPGFDWRTDPQEIRRTCSFGAYRDVVKALRGVKREGASNG